MNKNRNSSSPRFYIQRALKASASTFKVLLFSILLSGTLLAKPVTSPVNAQDTTSIEYKVKAAYIFKFFNFFEWNNSDTTIPKQPFRVGVFGDSAIYAALENLSKVSGGEGIIPKKINVGDSLKGLHLLFLSKSSSDSLQKIIQESQSLNILTVGEETSFCLKGGAVNFIIDNEKVKFEINRQAVKKAGIQVSARILKAAIHVYP
jgi:hypothetical protein